MHHRPIAQPQDQHTPLTVRVRAPVPLGREVTTTDIRWERLKAALAELAISTDLIFLGKPHNRPKVKAAAGFKELTLGNTSSAVVAVAMAWAEQDSMPSVWVGEAPHRQRVKEIVFVLHAEGLLNDDITKILGPRLLTVSSAQSLPDLPKTKKHCLMLFPAVIRALKDGMGRRTLDNAQRPHLVGST